MQIWEDDAGRNFDEQSAIDGRSTYELTKREFPNMLPSQARMIHRAYQAGVLTGKGLGVVSS